jgi:hypothetical protein
MLNHLDEAKRLQALATVSHGHLYDLGRVLDESIPVFPGRYFRQTLVSTAQHANTVQPVGENEVNWVTEVVTGTMQLGTHLDALSHLQIGERGYNGWSVCELASPSGAAHLGVETVPQIVTRGWLIDVPAARDVEQLEAGDVIRIEDLGDLQPEPGDAVIFHTGPGGVWLLSPTGEHLGTLRLPESPHNLAWGDDDARTLYVTALTSIYRIRLAISGIRPE